MVTETSQWQHLPTGENLADLSTRGAALDELLGNSLWWHGPKWLLSEDKAGWPKMDVRSRPLPCRKDFRWKGSGRCCKCSSMSPAESSDSRS